MGLSDLPAEILEIILSYCNKDTIRSVSLVSPTLHGPALQQLYRHILPADGRYTISLLWALVQMPFAAAHVRTLHVRGAFCLARDVFRMPEMDIAAVPFGTTDVLSHWVVRAARAMVLNQTQESTRVSGASLAAHPSQEEDHFFDNTMNSSIPVNLVERAFRNMTSLQKLYIHSPTHPLMWAFSYEMPVLKHVTIHQNAASPLLLCWLAKQSALTSIEYFPDYQYIAKWFPDEGPEVERHFLPKLRDISTNVSGVVLFVPGRPVRSIHMRIAKDDASATEGLQSETKQYEEYAVDYAWRQHVTRKSSLKNVGRAWRASTQPIQKLGLSPASVTVLEPFLRLAVEILPAVLTHLIITMDHGWALDPLLERHLGSLTRLHTLEVPSDHSIPAEHNDSKKSIIEILEYNRERESRIKDSQLTKVTRWATLAPALRTVILHPETPLLSSVARHSAMHGTGKYESLIVEWSIAREGTVTVIVPVE